MKQKELEIAKVSMLMIFCHPNHVELFHDFDMIIYSETEGTRGRKESGICERKGTIWPWKFRKQIEKHEELEEK